MRIPTHWLSKAEVGRRLGIHPHSVDAVAFAAGIRVRDIPATPRRYHADDVGKVQATAERTPNAEPSGAGRVA